jgi:hypothetical protein
VCVNWLRKSEKWEEENKWRSVVLVISLHTNTSHIIRDIILTIPINALMLLNEQTYSCLISFLCFEEGFSWHLYNTLWESNMVYRFYFHFFEFYEGFSMLCSVSILFAKSKHSSSVIPCLFAFSESIWFFRIVCELFLQLKNWTRLCEIGPTSRSTVCVTCCLGAGSWSGLHSN